MAPFAHHASAGLDTCFGVHHFSSLRRKYRRCRYMRSFGDVLRSHRHLTNCLVAKNVPCIPIDASLTADNNIVAAVIQSILAGAGCSTSSPVLSPL